MSIEAIGYAVPGRRETAAEIADTLGIDCTFVRDKIGIHTRYLLAPDETGLDLAEAAVRNLVLRSGLNLEQVGLLIYITQNPDRRIPHNAAPLSHRLGLVEQLASFDLSLGCSGFVYGLSVAEAMLTAQQIDHAIVVTCDPYSRIMDRNDRATNAVFGDAATATWVSRTGTRTMLTALDFGTDGSQADAIRIDAGGAASPIVSLEVAEGVQHYDREALRLHMEGRKVFNFVNSFVPKSISNCLDKAGLDMESVDLFALHQGSAYMLNALARRVGIPPEKVLMNIDCFGNTVSSTIPLLLEPLFAESRPDVKRVLISGFGVGLSWATGLLSFE